MFNLAAWPWTAIVVVLTVLVGLGIAYGMYRTRNLTAAEVRRSEDATRDLYDREP